MIAIALMLLTTFGIGATASAKETCGPFATGEKTVFSVTYLGATAGSLALSAEGEPQRRGRAFIAKLKTDPFFSLFYRVENTYESISEPPWILPAAFRALIDEKKQKGSTSQFFDRGSGKFRFVDDRMHDTKGIITEQRTAPMPKDALDAVSALFYVRTFDPQLAPTIEFPVIIGKEVVVLRFTRSAEEELPTALGAKPSWVYTLALRKDGATKEIPDTSIWIGKEITRPILKIKAKVKIGSVIAYLKSYEPGTVSMGACAPAPTKPPER